MTHHDVHMYDAEAGGWFMKSNHRLGPIIHGFMVQLVSHYTHPLSCWNAGGHGQCWVRYESHTP